MADRADRRPGESVSRLARLVAESVSRCDLDLAGVNVLTEAATGAYVVTPVIAALAGATVTAITRDSRYGTIKDVAAETYELAGFLAVDDRITIAHEPCEAHFAAADLITNSGHVRPIVGKLAQSVRPDAVLSLMFETWEIDAGRVDIELGSLKARGVRFAGTNERHPNVDVFSYLGPMAVVELADAGIPAYNSRIGVLCDNPFESYLSKGLVAAGASVVIADRLTDIAETDLDAVIVSLTPRHEPRLTAADVAEAAARWPGAPLVQFWGDVDRDAAALAGVECWPRTPPRHGHMGVLPSRLGPDATVRLQAGGLKVGQVLLMPDASRTSSDLEYVDEY